MEALKRANRKAGWKVEMDRNMKKSNINFKIPKLSKQTKEGWVKNE